MTKLQYPFDYSDLEPAAAEVALDDVRPSEARTTSDAQAEAFAFSQAISLKRIADALEKIERHFHPVFPMVRTDTDAGMPHTIIDTMRPKE